MTWGETYRRSLARGYDHGYAAFAANRAEERAKRKEQKLAEHVDSTSDGGTANNTMRHKYRVLREEEKQQMSELKDMGAAFLAKCDEIGGSRELSLAKTKMEEAVMWSVKHVTA